MQDERVDMLRRENIPFVLIGRCADNADLTYVDVDIQEAMESSFAHLTTAGHQSIAYLYFVCLNTTYNEKDQGI